MEIPYDQLQHAFDILQEQDGLRQRRELCDFVIKVGLEEIQVNRSILCGNSEYFRAMFSHDTLENQTGRVEYKDLDLDCVRICIDFMYGRKISITKEKWEKLILCADRLRLMKLRTSLENFLKSALAPDVFYDIRRIAKAYSFADLVTACNEFAAKNFRTISLLDEFSELENEDIASMVSSELNVSSQATRTKTILCWIKYDVENRRGHLLEMLQLIDFSQVPLTYRRFLIYEDDLISQSLDCVKLLSLSVMDSFSVWSSNLDPALEKADSILVFDGKSRRLQCYDPETSFPCFWNEMQALDPDMAEDCFSAVTLHIHVYALVRNNLLRLNYTDSNATWQKITSVPGNLVLNTQMVADSRYIYLVDTFLHRYDTINNEWIELAESRASYASSCVMLNGKIYCIGGHKDGIYLSKVEVFDLDSKVWSVAAPLTVERGWAGATACFGKLFVIGGQRSEGVLSTVECYDQKSDSWSAVTPLLQARTGLPVVAIGDSIFASGHFNSFTAVMQRYDMKRKIWTTHMGKNLKVLSCVGINMKSLKTIT